MGSIAITGPLALTTDYVSLDGRYTDENGNPYASVAAAEAALGRRMNKYTVGLTVLVKESGWTEAKEYWVQPKGTTPETYGLVEKGAGTTDYNDLDNKPTISDGGQGSTQIPIAGNVKVSASTASGETAGVTITQGQSEGEIEMNFTLPKGADGEDGDDAYEVYKSTVPSGETPKGKTEWLASLKGADGQNGADGAPGHNPCLGRFNVLPTLSPNPFADARNGDYIYFDTTDQQTSDPVTYIYYFDGTDWDTTGTLVDVSNLSFNSGQAVIDVKIMDENGEEVGGTANVFSAEAGAGLKIVYGSLTECDLDIRDEQGHALAMLSGGNIRTKNFDSAKTPSVKDMNYPPSDLDIEDESGNVLARFADGGIRTKNFDSGRVRMFSYGESRASFQYPVDCQRPDTVGWQTATVVNDYTQQVLYTDNAVLYLPESYSPNGTPTRLIIYCKHGASTVEPGSDYVLSNSGDGNIFHFLLKLGYAVLAADGVPNDYAAAIGITERVVGNYIAIQSTRNAYNHVVKNYNIADDGVFVYGWSQGGMYAQNVADLCGFNVLAVAELSPVCSYQWHQWDLVAPVTIGGVTWQKSARLNIARLFNFPTVTTNAELDALTFDETKVTGYDPWTRNVENPFMGFEKQNGLWRLPSNINLDDITMKKNLSAPLKIWCANNDPVLGVDVMKVFIKAAKNAGCIADLHLMTSGGHNINSAQSAIGTFNYKGSTYNLYPLAYEIARWFRDFGGLEFTV